MFKDFQRRLQRDIKKRVDARTSASEKKSGGDHKVSLFYLIAVPLYDYSLFHDDSDHVSCRGGECTNILANIGPELPWLSLVHLHALSAFSVLPSCLFF